MLGESLWVQFNKNSMAALNFRLPEEEFSAIQKAATQNQTVSDFVRAAVSKEMASTSGLSKAPADIAQNICMLRHTLDEEMVIDWIKNGVPQHVSAESIAWSIKNKVHAK